MSVYPAANTVSTSQSLRQAHAFTTTLRVHGTSNCTLQGKKIGPYIFLTSPAEARVRLASTSSAKGDSLTALVTGNTRFSFFVIYMLENLIH